MKNLFIDTNILLDVLLNREHCKEARSLMEHSSSELSMHVSTLTMANIAYILRKKINGEKLYETLEMLSGMFYVDSLTTENFFDAIDLRASDFEDALQYCCAKENFSDCIITHNKKDFPFSTLPVYTPMEFMKQCL